MYLVCVTACGSFEITFGHILLQPKTNIEKWSFAGDFASLVFVYLTNFVS